MNDKLNLKNHVLPKIGKIKLLALTAGDIQNIHLGLKNKPIMANRCLALISKMLGLASKWGLREEAEQLCKHIDKYPEKKRERFLSMTEIERLFDTLNIAESQETEAASSILAIKLLLLSGCRLSEILELKWDWVDIANHRINFPDSKTGKKTIYISNQAIELISSVDRSDGNPYVIKGLIPGTHLVNLHKPWYRISKLADLEDVRLHDLRHSFASIGAASGLSLPLIGALLGHTQAQTTARYAHLVGDSLKDAAGLIGERIKSVM